MLPRIVIDSSLAGLFRLHVFAYDGLKVTPSAPEQCGMLRVLERELHEKYHGMPPAEISGLQAARKLYRATGLDPTRTRPSSEALLRRVLKGQELYQINNLVDAGNELSLRLLLPLGLYDLDCITGSITARLGAAGEEYSGIRKDTVHLEGRLGLFDDQGPFGSPTSDSPRSCITEQTHRALVVIYLPADCEDVTRHLAKELGRDLLPARTGCKLVAEELV